MGCYHPMLRYPMIVDGQIKEDHGKQIFKIRSLYDGEYEELQKNPDSLQYRYSQLIPCGHCIGCKLDYSRQWADRMIMELQSAQGKGIFVTFTYPPESVPMTKYEDNTGVFHLNYSLKKSECQSLLKNLRIRFSGDQKKDGSAKWKWNHKDIPKREIRFFAAGEYGEMNLRPHFHIVFFGIDLDDVQASIATYEDGSPRKNQCGDVYYKSELLEDIWKRTVFNRMVKEEDERLLKVNGVYIPFKSGLVMCANVTWKTCAYVARYVTKKWQSGYGEKKLYKKLYHGWSSDKSLTGPYRTDKKQYDYYRFVDAYDFFGIEPEFSLMSRKPGIGSSFFDDFEKKNGCMYEWSNFSVTFKDGCKQVRMPRYFKDKYKNCKPIVDFTGEILNFDEMFRKNLISRFYADKNREDTESHTVLELSKTDLEYLEYLEVRERNHLAITEILKRDKA